MINFTDEEKKKKDLALNTSPDGNDEDIDDEDLALLSREFNRCFIRRREGIIRIPNENNDIKCYKCKKPGHIMASCPPMKNKPDKHKR